MANRNLLRLSATLLVVGELLSLLASRRQRLLDTES